MYNGVSDSSQEEELKVRFRLGYQPISASKFNQLKQDIETNPWCIKRAIKTKPSELNDDISYIPNIFFSLMAYSKILAYFDYDTGSSGEIEKLSKHIDNIYAEPGLASLYESRIHSLCRLRSEKKESPYATLSTACENIERLIEDTHVIGRLASLKKETDVKSLAFDFYSNPDSFERFAKICSDQYLDTGNDVLSDLVKALSSSSLSRLVNSSKHDYKFTLLDDKQIGILAVVDSGKKVLIEDALSLHSILDISKTASEHKPNFINKDKLKREAEIINDATNLLTSCLNDTHWKQQLGSDYESSDGEDEYDNGTDLRLKVRSSLIVQ